MFWCVVIILAKSREIMLYQFNIKMSHSEILMYKW